MAIVQRPIQGSIPHVMSLNDRTSKTAPPSRVCVNEQVYHQEAGQDPTIAESQFERHLKTNEQAYYRKLDVKDDEWIPLPVGWIKDCSILYLRNEEGKNLTVIPTAEQKQDTAARVIQIALYDRNTKRVHEPFAEIHPYGESARFTPVKEQLEYYRIRCKAGTATMILHLMPN